MIVLPGYTERDYLVKIVVRNLSGELLFDSELSHFNSPREFILCQECGTPRKEGYHHLILRGKPYRYSLYEAYNLYEERIKCIPYSQHATCN